MLKILLELENELEKEYLNLKEIKNENEINKTTKNCKELIGHIKIYVYSPECKYIKYNILNKIRNIENDLLLMQLKIRENKITKTDSLLKNKENSNLEKLQKCREDLLNIENIGLDITKELSIQTEKLNNIKGKISKIDPELNKSNSLLNRMSSWFRR
jgi:hypothetical protein